MSKHNRFAKALLVACLVLCCTATVSSQSLSDNLKMFEPLIGKEWVGELDGLEMISNYKIILNGQAVRRVSAAPELDYSSEMVVFWEPQKKAVAFHEVTSRGHLTRGTVSNEEDLIVLTGSLVRPQDIIEFRNTFELTSDGTLIDTYYVSENDEWEERHLVESRARD